MNLSEELEPYKGTVVLMRPEWIEQIRKLERLVAMAGSVHRELSIVAAERTTFWDGTSIS